RNTRLAALGAVMLGAIALVKDLGRPERFVNMLRTFKLTSPMSVGSWILSFFSAGIGVAAASEVDRMTGERLPLGPLRPVLRAVEGPA
ncbi:NrfD/PsrC family molybdoenzyme membrane anchor subunit, partial [Mycobacterium kansasii]